MSSVALRDEHEYIYAVARIRVLETKLLDRATLFRMVEAGSAQEAFGVLSDTEYAPFMQQVEVHDFEKVLSAHLKWVFGQLSKFVPDGFALDLLGMKMDFHNLKVLLKSKLFGAPVEPEALYDWGTLPPELLRVGLELLSTGGDPGEAWPESLTKCARGVLGHEGIAGAPQLVDFIVDRWFYETRLDAARASRRELLAAWAQACADVANMKVSIRAAASGVERKLVSEALVRGGSVEVPRLVWAIGEGLDSVISLWAKSRYADAVVALARDRSDKAAFMLELEKWADNYLLGFIQRARYLTMGPEPIVAYLSAKEFEVKNLRIILTGKINGLPAQVIRERLRDVYA
ncbi:MAG: V-type ATPase subunit [Bacillota bacterium]